MITFPCQCLRGTTKSETFSAIALPCVARDLWKIESVPAIGNRSVPLGDTGEENAEEGTDLLKIVEDMIVQSLAGGKIDIATNENIPLIDVEGGDDTPHHQKVGDEDEEEEDVDIVNVTVLLITKDPSVSLLMSCPVLV